jgi:hypothetical protein
VCSQAYLKRKAYSQAYHRQKALLKQQGVAEADWKVQARKAGQDALLAMAL